MTARVEAILFDVGGTLRSSLRSPESVKREKVQRILGLVNARLSAEEFSKLLTSRAKAYSAWARQQCTELNEFDLWTRWMLPDYPAACIGKLAVQLNQLWREAIGIREILPETKGVLVELFRRGYRLGIASNTSSSVEVPQFIRELEITGLFETVILSSVVGIRKPDPGILLEAASRMGIEPSKCVYVGDRHDRDVVAAREAGFSKAVILRGIETLIRQQQPDATSPAADYYIDNLAELLDIFPPLSQTPIRHSTYNASCSTMWARRNFPDLSDFFEAIGRLGFTRAELNHQVNSAMLSGIDLKQLPLSSLHEPCPADVSVEELKARDWLISSTNEECRRQGLNAIKRSVDLAADLGVPVIVVHAGMVSTESGLERTLRNLFKEGQTSSNEYREVQDELIGIRQRLAPACLEAVRESLRELLDYAGRIGVRLGLENRFHYYDIPNPDEMGELLALADDSRLGFVYDVGHAQNLDRLGFYPHEDWLRRYSTRIIEVHLHDVKGISDHLAPGLGEVDFDMVASYLPQDAIRTLEVQMTNSPEQVKAGLKYLAQHGCIKAM